MPALPRSTGDATLTADTVSKVLEVSNIGEVQFTIIGDADTGTLTLQQRFGSADDWRTFSPQGSPQTFDTTTLNATTASHMEVYTVGGCQLRFSLAAGGELQIEYESGGRARVLD